MHAISAAASCWWLSAGISEQRGLKFNSSRHWPGPVSKGTVLNCRILNVGRHVVSFDSVLLTVRKYNLISCSVNYITDHIPEGIVIIRKSCSLSATTCGVFWYFSTPQSHIRACLSNALWNMGSPIWHAIWLMLNLSSTNKVRGTKTGTHCL